jgi:hypothetical protein
MTFKDDLLTDARDVFLGGNDEFDESVSYTPSGESARSINVLLVKDALEPGKEGKRLALHNQAEMYIANDATDGVTSINKTSDRVAITDRDGNAQTARIVNIISSDDGIWHVLIEW